MTVGIPHGRHDTSSAGQLLQTNWNRSCCTAGNCTRAQLVLIHTRAALHAAIPTAYCPNNRKTRWRVIVVADELADRTIGERIQIIHERRGKS